MAEQAILNKVLVMSRLLASQHVDSDQEQRTNTINAQKEALFYALDRIGAISLPMSTRLVETIEEGSWPEDVKEEPVIGRHKQWTCADDPVRKN